MTTLRLVTLGAVVTLAARAAAAGTVTEELRAMMDESDATTRLPVIVELADQVDVAAAVEGRAGKDAVVPALVDALKTKAATTQNAADCGGRGLLDELAGLGPDEVRNVRSFWIVNAVALETTKDVIGMAAARDDVATVRYDGMTTRPAPAADAATPFDSLAAVRAVEARAVGDGTGTVVGLVGTGADAEHPALRDTALRRSDGSVVWRDAVGGRPVPYDDHGEGTHLLGVAVGANGLGVAPGARWIACKGIGLEAATVEQVRGRLLDCLQWMLDPDEPAPLDSGHVPDVVLLPWWIDDPGHCDPDLLDPLRVLRAAGIVPVVAVGHDTVVAGAPAPADALPSPANYPEAFAVGASAPAAPAELLATSYRGTAGCRKPTDRVPPNLPDRAGPQVVAPGVDVASAWPGGGTRILVGNPEGVAAAHVAGAAALLRSVAPTLDPAQVEDALRRTAAGWQPGPPERPGLLDVLRAVTFEDATFTPPATPPPAGTVTDAPAAASVTMTNSGVTTWRPGVQRLAALAPVWGPTLVDWSEPRDPASGAPRVVLPGERATFRWTATAPHVPGTYDFQWRMVNGSAAFGTPSDAVRVPVVGTDVAVYQGRTPATLAPGTCATADVAFRNQGTNTWAPGVYALTEVDAAGWAGGARAELAAATPPTAVGHFRARVCAPRVQGTYDFAWALAKDGRPLGTYTPNDRVLVLGTDDAILTAFAPPPWEMRPGSGADVRVVMANAGTNAWLPGYCLKCEQASFWHVPDVCLGATDVVYPGGAYAFVVHVTAPDGRQRQWFNWRLHTNAGAPFGPLAWATVGMPWEFQASAGFSAVQGQSYWFYRYWNGRGWAKMSWVARQSQWRGADPTQLVWVNGAWPGDPNPSGRFWQSPVAGRIRVTSRVVDNNTRCGDGVDVRVWRNRTLLFDGGVGAASPTLEIRLEGVPVAVNDTVRFTVNRRTTNACDGTMYDPLVQILPPDTVGRIPSPTGITPLDVEP
ncbi:MAG TPA: S8 family serine peptidase [Candidatus Binatia bacterium]|nr:S8 family serine peptidase [Candidatus Binatia bacterium]